MDDIPLNALWTVCNTCFGCGKDNELGLQISVFRDPTHPDRIIGNFQPKEYMTGFSGILHGGVIFTALDCMATWSGMILRPRRALWVLRSVTLKYHRPAMQVDPVSLTSHIEAVQQPGDDMSPIEVRGEARNPGGELLVEGTFKCVPISLEKFTAATGITDRTSAWARWVEHGPQARA